MANPTFIDAQMCLADLVYPASKREIVETARWNGATGAVLHALESLPDSRFAGASEVSEAVAPGPAQGRHG